MMGKVVLKLRKAKNLLPWKCRTKKVGGIGSSVRMFFILPLHLKSVFKMILCNNSFPVSFGAAF